MSKKPTNPEMIELRKQYPNLPRAELRRKLREQIKK
jgi:hypothetical protein